MKTFTLIFAALLITLSGCAKNPESGYKKFFNEYHKYPNATSFKIPAGLATFFIGDEDEEAKEFMDDMDDISFLVFDKLEKQLLIDLNTCLPAKDYKEMMVVRDGTSEVTFLAKDNGTYIEEIVMTVVDANELVVMCITGEFTKESAKKLTKSINIGNATKMKQ
ncbi:MAG TPA: hypothetical protein DCQ26_16065 [Marinilabiliales bacterium]|jgi:hypothetical protein|nr:MAG: hypothetical protein A2W95_05215 [Bacteroidetes bacterium GWA2_40_14]OFX60500.1 MAG: hypothetical protein A2W84_05300 [Bacteroidetes bacterium GWC2_40_13]OFX75443.1 MAG: hypothetical protein A2W96_08270 [Bacteroidetes bacterium GWD2_40_43]OFX93958.1 MAG: hypothetical protein A2W97_14195 [Bacteroidetes bacterium GWE2_40_63]OFY19747.1 MAG: hypothetical protein A2W88_03065 [Bacteroidetes bacterium GWF2_40_13]OFZ24533.1 MAG: hypothetical protein A2437_01320 [Bacteroidetes bacterium RIFOXYC